MRARLVTLTTVCGVAAVALSMLYSGWSKPAPGMLREVFDGTAGIEEPIQTRVVVGPDLRRMPSVGRLVDVRFSGVWRANGGRYQVVIDSTNSLEIFVDGQAVLGHAGGSEPATSTTLLIRPGDHDFVINARALNPMVPETRFRPEISLSIRGGGPRNRQTATIYPRHPDAHRRASSAGVLALLTWWLFSIGGFTLGADWIRTHWSASYGRSSAADPTTIDDHQLSISPTAVAACAVTAVVFGVAVLQFYDPATGFTRLSQYGSRFEEIAPDKVKDSPHYVYADAAGYDGQFYAWAAVDPLFLNERPVDLYRARRILIPILAWIAALGDPERAIGLMATQNILCWFALGLVMFRWIPPTSLWNFGRWLGCMFGVGLAHSVRFALLDGPSILAIALAVAAVESRRFWTAAVVLGFAGLIRETNLLACGIVVAVGAADWSFQRGRPCVRRLDVWRSLARAAIVAAPLALWLVRMHAAGYGTEQFAGADNFALPMLAYWQKWRTTIAGFGAADAPALVRFSLYGLIALSVQAIFFFVYRRRSNPWWRVGSIYAVLMLVLGLPVWEGNPGAAHRLLLPMTFAFNVLMPRGRLSGYVLFLGNLAVLPTFRVLAVPWLARMF